MLYDETDRDIIEVHDGNLDTMSKLVDFVKVNFSSLFGFNNFLNNELVSISREITVLRENLHQNEYLINHMFEQIDEMKNKISDWNDYPETKPPSYGEYLVTTNEGKVEKYLYIKDTDRWENDDVISWQYCPEPSPKWLINNKKGGTSNGN
jgi:hypothetical protein